MFTPQPDGKPALTAQDAWHRYGGNEIPDHITPAYGTLTWPGTLAFEEKQQYVYKDEPVWGYRWEGECPLRHYDSRYESSVAATQSSCVYWTFLNPETGKQLIETVEE